ncbi:AbrB/MazE/SpoVT family DNA-binding domain-containing protein [Candidatus Gottesmanbacteria bacterium]|nr:AbrB/MazE/SpoVT family DNA-binding domain-containing protein [Candidatus Gottesmanbacteria bacterium]MBI5452120.1 AbrB/MazE/SpoVT family DNA-binding domain-containing protein [Candidatus Gottesmanbacteria bacterium]
MIHRVIRSGKSSLAVIVPAEFIHALGIKPGDKVKVATNKEKGTVNLHFSGAIQLHLPSSQSEIQKKKAKST